MTDFKKDLKSKKNSIILTALRQSFTKVLDVILKYIIDNILYKIEMVTQMSLI